MIYGIMGLAGSGKTTVADVLAEETGAHVLSVAAPIRAMLLALGLQDQDFRGRSKERVIGWIGKSPRELMQSLGDWGREQNQNIWATLLDARVSMALEPKIKPGKPSKAKAPIIQSAIVDDIRFPLEAAVIRNRGGYLIRVIRPGMRQGAHVTERNANLIQADVEFQNTSGLDGLKAQVLDWLDEIENG